MPMHEGMIRDILRQRITELYAGVNTERLEVTLGHMLAVVAFVVSEVEPDPAAGVRRISQALEKALAAIELGKAIGRASQDKPPS
jgi:hypothetical protein